MYVDFEDNSRCENNSEIFHVTEISKHTCCSFFHLFLLNILMKNLKTKQFSYEGPESTVRFCKVLKNISHELIIIEIKTMLLLLVVGLKFFSGVGKKRKEKIKTKRKNWKD